MKTKQLSRFAFAIFLLGFATIAVQPAKADDVGDPTIQVGVVSSLPGGTSFTTENGTNWVVANSGGIYFQIFQNTSTSTWTALTIAVTDGGTATSGVSFTNDAYDGSLFTGTYPGTTAAFGTPTTNTTVCMNCQPGTVYDFDYTGGTGVAANDYLIVRYNGFPQGPPDSSFNYTVSTSSSDSTGTDAPEPSSVSTLGVGLLCLFGLVGLARRRLTAVTEA